MFGLSEKERIPSRECWTPGRWRGRWPWSRGPPRWASGLPAALDHWVSCWSKNSSWASYDPPPQRVSSPSLAAARHLPTSQCPDVGMFCPGCDPAGWSSSSRGKRQQRTRSGPRRWRQSRPRGRVRWPDVKCNISLPLLSDSLTFG